MPGLTYTLSADPTGVIKGTQRASEAVNGFKKKVSETNEQILSDARKANAKLVREQAGRQTPQQAGFRNLGNTSLQVQDIAVQMQAGTKASTILMQQGTQLLSVFGPAGAIAGGILGLGVLIYNTMNSSAEQIKKLRIEGEEMMQSFNKAARLNTFESFTSYVDKSAEAVGVLKKQIKELSTEGGFEALLKAIPGLSVLGNKSQQNREESMQPLLAAKLGYELKTLNASNALLDITEKEVEIIQLKADGNEKLAEQKEYEIKLQKDIDAMWETAAAKNSAAYAEEMQDLITKRHELERQIKLKKEESEAAEKAAREKEKAEREAAKKEKEAADEKKKTADDIARQIKETQDRSAAESADIVDRENKKRQETIDLIKKAADEQSAKDEAALKRIEAENKKKQDAIENQLSVEQKLQLAKERVAKAQSKLAQVGPNRPEDLANLAEAQTGLIDAREAMIQRIMGGSTSAAEAARAEKREARARARAERILDKRQALKDKAAIERGEKVIQPDAAKDPVKAEVEKGNSILDKINTAMNTLNQKLTVA